MPSCCSRWFCSFSLLAVLPVSAAPFLLGSYVFGANLAITPAPTSIPFSDFKVNQLIINKRLGSLFLLSHLTLGQGNGIDPLTEPVTLSIGNATVKIPPGSFHKIHNLPYSFVGEIDNIWVEVLIKPLGGKQFGVQVSEYGTRLSSIAKPIEIKLTIGDDTGTTSFK